MTYRSSIYSVVLLLLLACLPTAWAAFSDVSSRSNYAEAIEFLRIEGIVSGYSDGTFRPNDRINRYDFLKIIIASTYPKSVIDFCDIDAHRFADVPRGHWSEPYLCVAKREAVVSGYQNGMYGGDDPVRVAEATKIVLESLDIPLLPGNYREWYQPYLATADEYALLSGIDTNPFAYLNRGEMALLIYQAKKYLASQQAPTPSPDISLQPTPSHAADAKYKTVLATVFWAGEGAGEDNGFITNVMSAWDIDWMGSFGGYDDPDDRCGYRPCGFVPQENPFYYALPYNDLDDSGQRKASAALIPWYEEKKYLPTIIKNSWIEVVYNGTTCYGQWQDVGPYEEDDFDYVFGDAEPDNSFGVGAGIDLSPAIRDCLGMIGNQYVSWRFVDAAEVPQGPWTETVTESNINW